MKLFNKIAVAALGASMAMGVGIGILAHNRQYMGASAATTFQKVTSIAVNDVVTLVNESAKVEISGISDTSTKFGTTASYATNPAGSYSFTVVAGVASGYYSFKTSDDKYLTWTSGNSLNVGAEINDNTSWGVSFSSGNVVIANKKDSTRIIKYNSGSPRFACYTSNQATVQLYKQVEVEEGAVTGVALDQSFVVSKLSSGNVNLTATIAPDNATNKNVSWTSSDETVATVNESGVVTPLKKGFTVITVTTEDGGFQASCTISFTAHAGTEADPLSVSDAIIVAGATGTTNTASAYYIGGHVSEVSFVTYNSKKVANITLVEDEASISIFRLYDVGSGSIAFTDESKIRVNDDIVVLSKIQTYNSNPQAAYGNLVSVSSSVTLTSVEIRGNITRRQFVNEAWDISELSVFAIYSDDSETDVTASATITLGSVKPTVAGAQNLTVDATYDETAATQRVFNLTVLEAPQQVEDSLVYGDIEFEESTKNGYLNGSISKTNGSYSLHSNYNKEGQEFIQIRKDSPAGIVATSVNGKHVFKVTIAFHDSTADNRVVNIYGSDTAYESPADLFDNSKAGTLIGTITKGVNNYVLFNLAASDYKYFGIKATGGAAYLTSVTVAYAAYSSEENVAAVNTFITNNMHMSEDVEGQCNTLFSGAMVAFNSLTDEQRELFCTDNQFVDAYNRLRDWATAKGHHFDATYTIVEDANSSSILMNNDANPFLITMLIISSVALAGFTALIIVKKKKHQ